MATKKKRQSPPAQQSDPNVCFVISPIGQPGTERHTKFKEVFEYVIKSAIEASGYALRVIRADEIDRPGSFIKDILGHLYGSYVVIADLTEQNPNVFYELGVRHALSPRTILMAQSVDHIPSDLREYRTIVYDTSAKGAAEFAKRLKKYLQEMHKEPSRSDNPVLDRIGGIVESRIAALEAENQTLKNDLTKVLKGTTPSPVRPQRQSVSDRTERIIKLMGAERQIFQTTVTRGKQSFILPPEQGPFKLYFLLDGETIKETWYLAIHARQFDLADDLADARVLMQIASKNDHRCIFKIATNDNLSRQRKATMAMFKKMLAKLPEEHRNNFELHLWDDLGLSTIEKDLGLKI